MEKHNPFQFLEVSNDKAPAELKSVILLGVGHIIARMEKTSGLYETSSQKESSIYLTNIKL